MFFTPGSRMGDGWIAWDGWFSDDTDGGWGGGGHIEEALLFWRGCVSASRACLSGQRTGLRLRVGTILGWMARAHSPTGYPNGVEIGCIECYCTNRPFQTKPRLECYAPDTWTQQQLRVNLGHGINRSLLVGAVACLSNTSFTRRSPNAATPIYNHNHTQHSRAHAQRRTLPPARARWGNSNFQKSFPGSSIIQTLFPPHVPLSSLHELRIKHLKSCRGPVGRVDVGGKSGGGGGRERLWVMQRPGLMLLPSTIASRPSFIVTPAVLF